MKSKLKTPLSGGPATSTAVPQRPSVLTQEEIALRARSIWEELGRPHGRDEEIWLEAERRLRRGLSAIKPNKTAEADTEAMLGDYREKENSIEERLEGIGDRAGDRSSTSL